MPTLESPLLFRTQVFSRTHGQTDFAFCKRLVQMYALLIALLNSLTMAKSEPLGRGNQFWSEISWYTAECTVLCLQLLQDPLHIPSNKIATKY